MAAVADLVPPHLFWDYTYRELHAVLANKQAQATRNMQLLAFGAWQTENMARHKKLPNLADLLRKFEPVRVMSGQAIRAAVRNMARAMGAEVRKEKRGDR